ncbi:MAG: class I SAM-dependent methyltransferase [Roseiflexaceae bacterium]
MMIPSDPGVAVACLDWLAIWQQMNQAEHTQSEAIDRLSPPPVAHTADRWAGQADRYAQVTGRMPQPDAFLQFVLPWLKPTDTVLDIGAGAGRHSLFLAERVAEVVAVERSASMRQQLEVRIAQRGISNIRVVPAEWPASDLPPADVVICAHVIYGVPAIGPFLQALHAHARRAWFIAAGFRQPSAVLHPFWERIHGQQRLPLPGALECLNVLYQLGIPAQLNHIPASRYSYGDAEEALIDLRWRLRLPETPASDAAIREAIAELLIDDGQGRLMPANQPQHSAVIWREQTEQKVV